MLRFNPNIAIGFVEIGAKMKLP
jgi:hypothetical protein